MGREWKRYHYPGQKDVYDDDGNVRFHKVGLVVVLTEIISNSNWTECSTIRGVLGRVVSKSDEQEARCQSL